MLHQAPVEISKSESVKNALDCRAALVLADLPDGSYVLRMTVRDGSDHETVARAVPFAIRKRGG